MSAAAGSFRIGFFNYDGTKQTIEDGGMKVWVKRKVHVRSKLPASFKVGLRAGITRVKSARVASASPLNNWWVTAVMSD